MKTTETTIRSNNGTKVIKNLTPARAIKEKCRDCGGCSSEPSSICAAHKCSLQPYGKNKSEEVNPRVLEKAIRQHCLRICMLGQRSEVKKCPSQHCSLFNFRTNYGSVPVDETLCSLVPVPDMGSSTKAAA
jgi:hypothetical protein